MTEHDVQAHIDAAYHCDAHGTEAEAIVHYDQAWRIGVPPDQRREFMLGYGSTLKNVGRLAESEAVLREAVVENPADRALPVFLALTLHARGRASAAVAQLIEVVLALGDSAPDVARYQRALEFYAQELATKDEPTG